MPEMYLLCKSDPEGYSVLGSDPDPESVKEMGAQYFASALRWQKEGKRFRHADDPPLCETLEWTEGDGPIVLNAPLPDWGALVIFRLAPGWYAGHWYDRE